MLPSVLSWTESDVWKLCFGGRRRQRGVPAREEGAAAVPGGIAAARGGQAGHSGRAAVRHLPRPALGRRPHSLLRRLVLRRL